MRLNFAIPLAAATALLSSACFAQAQITYAGGSTAGNLPATAEVVPGVAGVTYQAISGTTVPITSGDNTYNAEMYEITVASPASFTASTTAFVAGSNNFDDQLFLFNSSGIGIAANDDAASGGEEASLTVPSILAGTYFLLIDGSGDYPTSSTGLIFPNFADGTTDPSGTYGPTGPGGANAISGYTGSSNEGGNYVVALSIIPAVPEPSSLAAIAAGAIGLGLLLRQRRSS